LAAETEGPHGLQISRDGKYLHMTTGHGTPDGKYWKYELGPDTLVGQPIFLGNFPASIDVTPDGLYAFAVNFNLHGEMVPSSVSVIYTPTNTEVARPVTCTMPHGSRISADGMKQYSTCMMDDQLVEVDTRTFKVSRRLQRREASGAWNSGGRIRGDDQGDAARGLDGRVAAQASDGARDLFSDVGAAVGDGQQGLRRVQQERRDPRDRWSLMDGQHEYSQRAARRTISR
jgi:hypothetical protein